MKDGLTLNHCALILTQGYFFHFSEWKGEKHRCERHITWLPPAHTPTGAKPAAEVRAPGYFFHCSSEWERNTDERDVNWLPPTCAPTGPGWSLQPKYNPSTRIKPENLQSWANALTTEPSQLGLYHYVNMKHPLALKGRSCLGKLWSSTGHGTRLARPGPG